MHEKTESTTASDLHIHQTSVMCHKSYFVSPTSVFIKFYKLLHKIISRCSNLKYEIDFDSSDFDRN